MAYLTGVNLLNILNLTSTLFKKAVKYLIRNFYFAIGDQVFQQIIGIPTGRDPAPFLANLFLFYYE